MEIERDLYALGIIVYVVFGVLMLLSILGLGFWCYRLLKHSKSDGFTTLKVKTEFSKTLLLQTMIVFCSQLICAMFFSWHDKDTSVFMYTVPTSGGIYGAGVCFYLNKAKIENVFKGKVKFLETKQEMLANAPEDLKSEIEAEFEDMNASLDSKIKATMEEAVSETITEKQF